MELIQASTLIWCGFIFSAIAGPSVASSAFLDNVEPEYLIQQSKNSSSTYTLTINEVQYDDRAGQVDWIEIKNTGTDPIDVTGLEISYEHEGTSSTFQIDESCGISVIPPQEYVLFLESEEDEGEEAYTVNGYPISEWRRSKKGTCTDIAPNSYSCAQEKLWGKCKEQWMAAGNFCAQTCGRCKPSFDNFIKQNDQFQIAACKFKFDMQPKGKLSISHPSGSSQIIDEAEWNVYNQSIGFTVGRPHDQLDEKFTPLNSGTAGKKNGEVLTYGPYGPHWKPQASGIDLQSSMHSSFASNLPIVVIKTSSSIPQDPKAPADMWISSCAKQSGAVNMYMPQETVDTTSGIVRNRNDVRCSLADKPAYSGLCGIELRGRSSQRYPKKQYSIELWNGDQEGQDISILGMPAHEDWVFGAPYVDRAIMRDALAFDMYADQGYWVPKMTFVELFLVDDYSQSLNYNKHYKGIYAVKEKIQRSSNRVNIAKMDPQNLTDITGGYIVQMSSNAHDGMLSTGEPPKDKLMDEGPARISFVYPKRPTPLQKNYMANYLKEFQRALWGQQSAHPIHGYRKYIDTDSWIDYFLHTEVTKNLDGYISSVYLHKDKNGKLKAGPAWDYNLGFGQATYWNSYYVSWWDFTHVGPNQKRYSQIVHWYYKLLADPSFRRDTIQRYQELRRTVWSDQNIVRKLQSYRRLLSKSQSRNFGKWPISQVSTNHKYIPIKHWGNTWGQNVDGLQTWVLNRLRWMDEYIPKLQ